MKTTKLTRRHHSIENSSRPTTHERGGKTTTKNTRNKHGAKEKEQKERVDRTDKERKEE